MGNKSFTVLELLIVIALIGLLSSIVLVSFPGIVERANIAKGSHFSGQIRHGLGAYAVGIWDFNTIEAGNKVYDSSGNNNHGTVYGATLVKSIPELGYALSFDGVDDYVLIPVDSSLRIGDDFTIEFWVKPVNDMPDGNYQMLIHYMAGSESYIRFHRSGHIQFAFYDYNGNFTYFKTSKDSWPSQWYYIVFTYDKSTETLISYVNGSLDKSQSGYVGGLKTGTTALRIGYSSDSLNGTIGEVRVYNQALSKAEIKKNYVEGIKRHEIVFSEKVDF